MAEPTGVRSPAIPLRRPPARAHLTRRRLGHDIAQYGFLSFWALLCILPMVLVVSTAFKDPQLETGNPFDLFASFRPQNLVDAWTLGNFGKYLVNTVVIVVPTVIGTVVLSAMSGYALARFEFPFKSVVFFAFIAGLMVPFFAVMIPLYYDLKSYGLLDTPWPVILPSVAGAGGIGLPLGVFLMRAFFLDLPAELSDAALVDGASEWGVFRTSWRRSPCRGPPLSLSSPSCRRGTRSSCPSSTSPARSIGRWPPGCWCSPAAARRSSNFRQPGR